MTTKVDTQATNKPKWNDDWSAEYVVGIEQEIIDLEACLQVARDLADALEKERDRLRVALEKIAAIEDNTSGGDWDEIEEARKIAKEALK